MFALIYLKILKMGQVESKRRKSGIFRSSSKNSLSSMNSLPDEESGVFMDSNPTESTKNNLMYGRKTP